MSKPITDQRDAVKNEIKEWEDKKKANIGNYDLSSPTEKKETEQETEPKSKISAQLQQEENEKVHKILGDGGYAILHAETKENLDRIHDSTEARTKFIEAIAIAFGGEFFAKPTIAGVEPQTLFDPISLKALSEQAKANGYKGEDLQTLYEEAIQEERNSKAYKNAAFLKSIEVYEGGDFGDKQKVIIIAGASGSGKTSIRPEIVLMVTGGQKDPNANPAELTADQRLVVSVDGGIEREVSQIRDLMNDTALKLGFGGVEDLEEVTTKATKGEKLKKTIEAAANAKKFHLAIPTTTPTKELDTYMRDDKDVAYVSVENTQEVVSFISRRRAFASIGALIPKEGAKKPESKKPGNVFSYLYGNILAYYGVYEYAKKQKSLKKDPIIIKVTKGLILVKPVKPKGSNESVATEFISCSKKDPDCVLMTVSQKNAWVNASKQERMKCKDGEYRIDPLSVRLRINDWPLKKPSERFSKEDYDQALKDVAIVEAAREKLSPDGTLKPGEKKPTYEQMYHARYLKEYEACKHLSKEIISFVPTVKANISTIEKLQKKQVQKLVDILKGGKLSEKKAQLYLRLLRFHTAFTFNDLLNIFKNSDLDSSLKWPSSASAAKLMIKCLEKQERLLRDLNTSTEDRALIFIQIQALKNSLPKRDEDVNIHMQSVLTKIDTIQIPTSSLPPPPLPPTAVPKSVLAASPVPTILSVQDPNPATLSKLEPYVEGYPPKPQRRLIIDKMQPLSPVFIEKHREKEINEKMQAKETHLVTKPTADDNIKLLDHIAGKHPVDLVNTYPELQKTKDGTVIEYALEISGSTLDAEKFAKEQLMQCGDSTKIKAIIINGERLDEQAFNKLLKEAQEIKPTQQAQDPHPHRPFTPT